MELTFTTLTEWDDKLWEQLAPIYHEAFPHGAKPEPILRKMLETGIGCMHTGYSGSEPVLMAVTGFSGNASDQVLIIDYLAVRADLRGQGLGKQFLAWLCQWAADESGLRAIVIEVEAGSTEEHKERVHFWTHCGFILTDYIHQYIWVPEPYQAMVLPLEPHPIIPYDGQSLFRYINSFHQKSFRQR